LLLLKFELGERMHYSLLPRNDKTVKAPERLCSNGVVIGLRIVAGEVIYTLRLDRKILGNWVVEADGDSITALNAGGCRGHERLG